MKSIDITGRRFGKLVAVERSGMRRRNVVWKCVCDCGGVVHVIASTLVRGLQSGCGCLAGGKKDIAGVKFGKLTAKQEAGEPGRATIWLCECECGRITHVSVGNLSSGHTKSCGCLHAESITKHGHSNRTGTYRSWQSMSDRCRNEHHKNYHRYGGRGITVCERWSSFENFLADMGERPDGKTLDRIDNDGNYEPGNCRWATQADQTNNQSRNKVVCVDGVSKTLAQWGRDTGLGSLVYKRMHKGMSALEAVTLPRGGRRHETKKQ